MKANEFINSQPKDREWDAYGWGYKVPEVKCPVDGAPIVYNGNYFCRNYDNGCKWALSHPAASVAELDICEALGIDPTG